VCSRLRYTVPDAKGVSMPAPATYYDIATRRLDQQMDQIDQLDAKVATLYATSSGVLAVFAGLLSLGTLPSTPAIKGVVVVLLLLALALYLFLLVMLYLAYQLATWDRRPNLDDLQTNCAAYEEPVLQTWVADECRTAYRANAPQVVRKATFVRWALLAVPIESVALALAGGLTLVGK